MGETSNIHNSNTTMASYKFRFGTSDKTVDLTQEQLDFIPYLSTLVAHKDDFLSQNDNDEYVLNHPIEHTWLMVILRSIDSTQPYTLLDELSDDDNILDVLQLYDYLGMKPFPLPLLKETNLILSDPINTNNDEKRVEYHKATVSEARQTASEFIIALSKRKYNFDDSNTAESIFDLIRTILFNPAIFSSRFRYHTLTVVKNCCYSFFSKTQKRQLPTARSIARYRKTASFLYLYDNDKALPNDFRSAFGWRGVYIPIDDKDMNPLFDRSDDISFPIISLSDNLMARLRSSVLEVHYRMISIINLSYMLSQYGHREYLNIDRNGQNEKNDEGQSARSGRFNTLPKRPKVDKFKHRCGPKAQKYR